MQLKPKHSIASLKKGSGANRKKAERYFTGRTTQRQELKELIENKSPQTYKILHYYGIGGIGKTRLQKEMMEEAGNHQSTTIIGHLNFDANHLLRVENALVELREQFSNAYKIQFDWFDLACAVLWQKVNPHLSFQANQNELPFLEESTSIAELISLVDGLPFVQWVPKMMQFGKSISTQVKKLKMSTDELSILIKELSTLQPFEIEERLPLFFAEDLRRFLKSTVCTPIIFIDTYEVISDSGRHQGIYNEKEAWVQELILQLPEIVWVIFGRERLYWDREHDEWKKILNQTLIDPLSEIDAAKFLVEEGVHDEAVRAKMIQMSNGLPYQLDLQMDTYELIKETKEPEVADFSNSSNRIVERLIKYLTLSERELLKVLSFPRQWDSALFKGLIDKLSIGYPATAIDELSRFSFIERNNNDEWAMHPIMRQSFQRMMKAENDTFYNKMHRIMYRKYHLQIVQTGETLTKSSEEYLNEMAYHASKLKLTPQEENDLMEILSRFYFAGRYRLFTPLSEDLEKLRAVLTSPFSSAKFHAIIGFIASDQGGLDASLEHFTLAEQELSTVTMKDYAYTDLFLRVKREMAAIHIKRTSYDEARQILIEASESECLRNSTNLQLVHVLLQLGKLENDRSKKREAGMYYEIGFEVIERYMQQNFPDVESLCLKGALYEKRGEWLTSKELLEQRVAYKCAIACYEKATELVKKLPLELAVDSGLAWKRLAENYSKTVELNNETNEAFEKAIAIYDDILVENPNYIEALIKKGHAAVDYLSFLGKNSLYDEAETTYHLAINSFNEAIIQSADQAAAHNRIASAHREMAIVYFRMGKEELAQANIRRAIEESRLLIRRYPDYRHGQSTLKKINEVLINEQKAKGVLKS